VKSETLGLTMLPRVLDIADVMIEPRSVECRFWVKSRKAGHDRATAALLSIAETPAFAARRSKQKRRADRQGH
jgi:hypothetical protein